MALSAIANAIAEAISAKVDKRRIVKILKERENLWIRTIMEVKKMSKDKGKKEIKKPKQVKAV